jgi:hypothetical protein
MTWPCWSSSGSGSSWPSPSYEGAHSAALPLRWSCDRHVKGADADSLQIKVDSLERLVLPGKGACWVVTGNRGTIALILEDTEANLVISDFRIDRTPWVGDGGPVDRRHEQVDVADLERLRNEAMRNHPADYKVYTAE